MWKAFEISPNIPFQEMPEPVWIWLTKVVGAVLGSAISIVYVLPNSRREAAIRFIVGLIIGIIFGPSLGAEITNHFELGTDLSKLEIILMGSTLASLCAWWGLGVLRGFLLAKKPQSQTR